MDIPNVWPVDNNPEAVLWFFSLVPAREISIPKDNTNPNPNPNRNIPGAIVDNVVLTPNRVESIVAANIDIKNPTLISVLWLILEVNFGAIIEDNNIPTVAGNKFKPVVIDMANSEPPIARLVINLINVPTLKLRTLSMLISISGVFSPFVSPYS